MPPRGGRIASASLLAYAAPALPLAALTLPTYILLPTFYAQTLGLGLTTVGTILLVARLWDVLVDPVIGALSDRTAGRFGRRKPWVVLGMPLVAVASWLLFVPPDGAGTGHLLLWSLVLYTGWIMMMIPLTALGAELADDYHERSRIAGWREVATVLGTLVALGLPFALGHGDAQQPGPALHVMAITCVILLPATVAGFALMVPDQPVPARRTGEPGLWRRVRPILRNRPFRLLILAYLLNGIANSLPATLFLLYVEHVIGMPDQAGGLLFGYFLSGVVAAPLWVMLSRRIGKHRAWMVGLGWSAAVFVWTPFLGPGDAHLFLAIVMGTGLALGADLILPSAMQADVIDVDTAETGSAGGRGRAGLFFALWGMATKLALALAVGLSFPLLGLAGYDAGQGEMPPEALTMLAVLYGVAPVAFKLAALGLMSRYGLTAERQAALRLDIARQARAGGGLPAGPAAASTPMTAQDP